MASGARGDERAVGVISDTHGLLRPEAVMELTGSDLIIHAGDVGGPEILDRLRTISTVVAVRGNADRGPWAKVLPIAESVRVAEMDLYVLHDVSDLDLDPRATLKGNNRMGLREDAERLIETLQSVAARLGALRGSPFQKEYTEHLQRRLVPLVEDLRSMIDQQTDRSEILRAMAEIKAVMHEVNGAATRGEMDIFPGGLLNRFWQLSTIFQEQGQRDEHR